MPVELDILPPRYRGPQPVAHGGMGEIVRATDTVLGRAVAVKLLAKRYAADEDVRSRFTREALAAARLSGEPNTVTIYDVGEWNERPFIVMEYLSGGSLEQRLRESGAQPPHDALTWLEGAARALDAAHAQGVVHRDVKPGNLLLDRDGVVHVADFGIASAAGMVSLTAAGTVLGTAGYLAPEQARGERTTPASDRYALGVVAFELLTGTRPFASDSITAEATAHVNAPIPSASARNPALPHELDRVFETALAKAPGARFGSCGELVHALHSALDDAAGTTRIFTRAPAVTLPRGRSPWPLLAALLAALLVAGVVAAVLLTRGSGTPSAGPTTIRITQPGTTVVRTVAAPTPTTAPPTTTAPPPTTTAPPPTTTAPTTTTTPPPSSGQSGAALNDAGYSRQQAGDYAGALPLLEQAVTKLAGSRSLTEAFASYNLAFTRLQLGRCDGVSTLLDNAESIEGKKKAIDEARKQARKAGC